MALPVSEAFRQRMKEMEHTRNQRLSLLHAEKATQATKSQILSSKQINVAFSHRRCCLLHQKIATLNFKISALKSQLLSLDASYNNRLKSLRVLKREVEELEEVEKERNRFYGEKSREMEEFKENVGSFLGNCQRRVRELNEIQSNLAKRRCWGRYNRESEMNAAEMQKHELLARKASLDGDLARNRKVLVGLRKQLEEKREHYIPNAPSSVNFSNNAAKKSSVFLHFVCKDQKNQPTGM